jgi:23S rRNA pseudouridine1911/1915/1917 synthase
LDVQTSGLVVLAETKDAARRFQQLLLDGKVQKRYRALVPGQSFQANQTLEHQISDSVFGKPVPRLIAPINAATDDSVHKWRDACATIKSATRCDQLQELEVELHTGRTHQLRAQLAAIGSPIVDDALYKGLSGFMWRENSDDQQAAFLVTAADRSDAPIGLQCSELEFDSEVFHAGEPWWMP